MLLAFLVETFEKFVEIAIRENAETIGVSESQRGDAR